MFQVQTDMVCLLEFVDLQKLINKRILLEEKISLIFICRISRIVPLEFPTAFI